MSAWVFVAWGLGADTVGKWVVAAWRLLDGGGLGLVWCCGMRCLCGSGMGGGGLAPLGCVRLGGSWVLVAWVLEEEENMFILQDVPQGKPGYRRLFG